MKIVSLFVVVVAAVFFFFRFLCSRSRCCDTLLRILYTATTTVCFSFRAKKCVRLPLFILLSHFLFAYERYDCICWLLILHDMWSERLYVHLYFLFSFEVKKASNLFFLPFSNKKYGCAVHTNQEKD